VIFLSSFVSFVCLLFSGSFGFCLFFRLFLSWLLFSISILFIFIFSLLLVINFNLRHDNISIIISGIITRLTV
jgi:hypothetical protein